MTRIMHISDTHGNFPKLNGYFDLIIHSGDILPGHNIDYQTKWLDDNIDKFQKWIDEVPFLFIFGNHDFISPEYFEMILCTNGIKAINLNNKLVEFEGNKYYGFPYVPYINGTWNNELLVPDMKKEVDKAITQFPNDNNWTLVTHAPIYGVLDTDYCGLKLGNIQLLNVLNDYKPNIPSRLLCGHIHESCGIMQYNNMLCSNAATTQHIIHF